ncbi:hypothetical protein [Agromyces intestinalis]|uniref:hypothetical protein n=1 Tax=Agromyces intestinalis TaxID=2592652 RepID=UPI001AEF764E|nr:hypothetical protein [Agromyces intestinalis]
MTTQTKTTAAGNGSLGLGSVFLGSLPTTLLTDEAPDRYTVEAVFTRRPEREEVEQIAGAGTRSVLSQAGYPTVEVTVSDRRLAIANTNLEELRDGLAATIARRLSDISVDVRARREVADARFKDASEHEHVRSTAVAALAGSVTFDARPDLADRGHGGLHAIRSAELIQVADLVQVGDGGQVGDREDVAGPGR